MIDVVLPCLDEAEALPWVLTHMPLGYRPIVVNNGSGDGSAAIAAELDAEVVLRAAQAGWVLAEIDVAYHPRQGRSKVTGSVRGTARAVRDMRKALAGGPPS